MENQRFSLERVYAKKEAFFIGYRYKIIDSEIYFSVIQFYSNGTFLQRKAPGGSTIEGKTGKEAFEKRFIEKTGYKPLKCKEISYETDPEDNSHTKVFVLVESVEKIYDIELPRDKKDENTSLPVWINVRELIFGEESRFCMYKNHMKGLQKIVSYLSGNNDEFRKIFIT